MSRPHVLIAGGGIAGLTMALTLRQIGVSCVVYERARELRPLGVGVNLQPNAVRELEDLGIGPQELDAVGAPAREWALVGLNGREIYAEPRGEYAGYRWRQYAVHRGAFHMLLYRKVIERLGADAVRLGRRVTGYRKTPQGTVEAQIETASGQTHTAEGTLLVGADGIHSRVRAQMHPDQPPVHWGGAIMWRGATRARPVRTASSFLGVGGSRRRIILYPISRPDADGYVLLNWIAEKTVDATHDWSRSGWFREAATSEFADAFSDFVFDWLDFPALLAQADAAYENPMIDRDPLHSWVDGPVALMGDAAHPMYPTGSNGATQAIMDARLIGRSMLTHGVTATALQAWDAAHREAVNAVALRNREAGPFGLLNLVEERCGGQFDDINDVIPAAERAAFMQAYQRAAGFARDALNAAPPTIPPGARVRDA
ncbi:flavin-dependent oxidoreductase [Camelimonas abortus]|uniref:Flavin-dependent oxidoreductase n=1 Tax=Camelimonas abortus TaxID=1017184 RepID=A0ABV7LFP6_9HYPH